VESDVFSPWFLLQCELGPLPGHHTLSVKFESEGGTCGDSRGARLLLLIAAAACYMLLLLLFAAAACSMLLLLPKSAAAARCTLLLPCGQLMVLCW